MDYAKQWYLSKTIWGSIAVIAGLALGSLGVDASDQLGTLPDTIIKAISAVMELAGALLAIYGRVKATTKVK